MNVGIFAKRLKLLRLTHRLKSNTLCYSWLYEIWWTDRKKAPIDCQTPLFDITSKNG